MSVSRSESFTGSFRIRRVEVSLRTGRSNGGTAPDAAVSGGDGKVLVEVGDYGPGLTTEMVDQAFARFVSLDGRGGTGLGLPIARGIAQAHGGGLT